MGEQQTAVDKTGGKQKPSAQNASSNADAKLLADLQLAMELPLPFKIDYWRLEASTAPSSKKSILGIFKRKEFSEEEMSKLRQEAETAPGQARVKIQMLGNKFASNTSLMMLSAYCTYRMVLNSANRKEVLGGLKTATKEAAVALMSDGISLYNVEAFFTIYFEYLSRLKRFQVATYKPLREGGTHKEHTKNLATAIKVCDSLFEEKSRATKVLHQVRGKFKSSSYTLPWEFADIQTAGKMVEQSDYKVPCGPAEARELLFYSLALTETFARIPILFPLVESILKLAPESTQSLLLRKNSIQITQVFSQLNTAVQEEDTERQCTLARQIFKTSADIIQKMANQPIKQSFEADPFFHLSRCTLLTFASFDIDERKMMLQKSLKAMQHVAKLDLTKNHVYTESAQTIEKRLNNLLKDSGG
jgi:hypothetical protein